MLNDLLAAARPVEVAKTTVSDETVTARQEWARCPRCQARIPAQYSWCPECGASLKAIPCAYCGQTLPPGEPNCPHCGAPASLS